MMVRAAILALAVGVGLTGTADAQSDQVSAAII
jgi:hypothetical protein